MTDPALIDVDSSATYVKLLGLSRGVSAISNPKTEPEGGWEGAKAQVVAAMKGDQDAGPDPQLDVSSVGRGGWGFPFVETKDGALVDALEEEGHEPLSAEEFAEKLEEAPDLIYLKTADPKAARKAEKIRQVSRVDVDEIDTHENINP